jgi:chemotaxis response regulator CheB
VNAIRVLVANRPRMMRELIMAMISDQPDIEIVGEVPEESEIEMVIQRTRPDFLIITLDKLDKSDAVPTICQSTLRSHPEMRLIAISPARDNLMFYSASLQIRSDQLKASEANVLNALRGRPQLSGEVQ